VQRHQFLPLFSAHRSLWLDCIAIRDGARLGC
jgi:hypothetical protein